MTDSLHSLQHLQHTHAHITNTRVVLSVFEKFQKECLLFPQTIADLASRDSNIDALQTAGVMSLLRPLLVDNVPAIQHAAALALGRLVNYNEELAEAVVDSDILPQLVYSLAAKRSSREERFYKKADAFVLRAVAKHSSDLAQSVVDSGILNALATCFEEFDPGVKESAVWALGYIARHNAPFFVRADLAQAVVDAGAIPLLVLYVQESELSLTRIAAPHFNTQNIQKIAQSVVDWIPFISPLLENSDAKLRRQVCSALSQIAKHSVDLAETVVDGEIFPNALNCLKDINTYPIMNAGGIAAVVDYVGESCSNAQLPGIMTLGYIAAFSETLALGIILAKGVHLHDKHL
ncbi:Sperm-associated antigen 6 [Entophlyctis luteolus]|nr:Sperm-associated antigen 6 [Entophlyctis luteolus]